MKLAIAIMLALAVVASADTVWIKDGKLTTPPNPLGEIVNPNAEQYAAAGYVEVDAPEADRRWWIIGADGITVVPQDEQDATLAAEAEARAQEHAARFAALCEQIGGFVQSIRRNLVILGYDLPANANEIVADITARSLRDELTDEQDRARSRLADVYVILSNKGVGDAEINAVWEAIK